jgi:O-antigen/teichoic acid export membrane protein
MIAEQPETSESSKHSESDLKVQRDVIISNSIMFAVAGGLLTGIGLTGAILLFRHQLLSNIRIGLFLVFLPFVPLGYFNNFASRIALGMGQIRMFNLEELIRGSGLLIGTPTAILVFGRHLLPLVILRVILEVLIFIVLVAYVLTRVGRRLRPSLSVLRRQVRYGVRNYTGTLMWLFLLQSDLVLCNDFLGSRPTGVYSIAVSLGLPITLLASVAGTLVFQRVSADHDRRNRIDNTNRVVRLLVPLIGSAVVFIAVVSRWLIPLAYGRRFDGAVSALAILMPGLFILGLETVLMNFLAGEGSPAIVYRAPFVGLLLNVLVNLFVIPRWGIDGAAATSSVSYLVVFLLVLTHYVRTTGTRPHQLLLLKASDIRAVWDASAAGAVS